MQKGYLCPNCNASLRTSKKNWTYCPNYNWDAPAAGCQFKGYRGKPGEQSGKTARPSAIKPLATPSSEQIAIFNAGEKLKPSENMLITARAGSGKTTVLVELTRRFASQGNTVAILAFAKRDRIALEGRIPDGSAWIKTSNGAGLSILSDYARKCGSGGRVDMNDDVARDFLLSWLKEDGLIPSDVGESWKIPATTYSAILCAVNGARTVKLFRAPNVPTDSDFCDVLERFNTEFQPEELPQIIHYAHRLFRELASLKTMLTHGVDFTGQTFLPVYHNLTPAKRYARVLVDECQDQNPYNRALAFAFVAPGGSAIAVGDDAQAIYEWRGADSDAIGEIRKLMGSPIDLPLTVSRRCAKLVIRYAQSLVPDIQALPDAPEGTERHLETTEALFADLCEKRSGLVISRMNAPLVSCCLRLLTRGISAVLMRSNLVSQLMGLIDQISERNDKMIAADLIGRAKEWLSEALAKAAKKRNAESACTILRDKYECIVALASDDNVKTARDLKTKLLSLFPKTDETPDPNKIVVCSTVHGAKGGEAHRVYIFSPENQNNVSVFDAVWGSARERNNTLYVAVTRCERELVFVGPMPKFAPAAETTNDDEPRPEPKRTDTFRPTVAVQPQPEPIKTESVQPASETETPESLVSLARAALARRDNETLRAIGQRYKTLTGQRIKL